MKNQFTTKKVKGGWMVIDNNQKKSITKLIPDEQTANEIRDDFNAMSKKDFRPIGMPNFNNRVN